MGKPNGEIPNFKIHKSHKIFHEKKKKIVSTFKEDKSLSQETHFDFISLEV